jgi:hypothetical protein
MVRGGRRSHYYPISIHSMQSSTHFESSLSLVSTIIFIEKNVSFAILRFQLVAGFESSAHHHQPTKIPKFRFVSLLSSLLGSKCIHESSRRVLSGPVRRIGSVRHDAEHRNQSLVRILLFPHSGKNDEDHDEFPLIPFY